MFALSRRWIVMCINFSCHLLNTSGVLVNLYTLLEQLDLQSYSSAFDILN